MASKETSQVARNQNRGIKRPRGAPGGTSAHHKPTDFGDPNSLLGPQEAASSAETQSRDAAMSDEETVQPLSKRINRFAFLHQVFQRLRMLQVAQVDIYFYSML